MAELDAHARPPEAIRLRYKNYQKMPRHAIDVSTDIFDAEQQSWAGCGISRTPLPQSIHQVFERFSQDPLPHYDEKKSPLAYEHPKVPGLIIIPSLLPPSTQLSLLHKLLHRDLSTPSHKTNLHLHYNVAYPSSGQEGQSPSFFTDSALSLVHTPKDPTLHKPLSMKSCLNRKLRWVTLGGQYDWTEKVYPSSPPPAFPEDVGNLIEGLFPSMKAQAAIVNLYTPGDTLSLHRDVSEMCDRDLVSISLGCDGLFVAGLGSDEHGDETNSLVMRLRSGDAVVMSGLARYAWHGVPQILGDTCPEWMKEWPARSETDKEGGEEGATYELWKGWMARKRINLNVRQMWD
ncbi:hypothetical protein AAFC00_006349 [Neodothiora populina]|uniref:Fe2OG dioxygenase domain-containing protein n=1 Tax=Neodothiora populina TaxID=2781224 RepID=A0ABR3P504_9PEZI